MREMGDKYSRLQEDFEKYKLKAEAVLKSKQVRVESLTDPDEMRSFAA